MAWFAPGAGALPSRTGTLRLPARCADPPEMPGDDTWLEVRPTHAVTGVRLSAAVLAYYLAVTAVITLVPFHFARPDRYALMLRGTPFDVFANILMFVPLGLLFRLARPSPQDRAALQVLGLGMLASVAIEVAQLFEPDRFTSPLDVLANGTGAWLGALACDRAIRTDRAGAVLVGRLSLEVPLMGLAYLLVPLLWLGSVRVTGQSGGVLLLALPGLFGATLVADVHRHRLGRPGGASAGAVAAFTGFAMGVGLVPVAARHPGAALLLTVLVMVYTRIAACVPLDPAADRRFELSTLRRALPFYAAYLLVLAWSAGPRGSAVSTLVILGRIELASAFIVLGYLLAEWRGRIEPRAVPAVWSVAGRALPVAALAATGPLLSGGRGAAAVWLGVTLIATVYGACVYLLQRDHVRALIRAADAPSTSGMTSSANRSISSCCGENWSSSRSTPARSNASMRCATCEGVPTSPARSPRFETE